jgi:hypothetical protein
MSGVVAGLIASVKSTSPTPVNLVTNPSFTVNTTDWYSDDGNLTRNTVTFRSSPAALAYSGNDASPATYYYKNNLLTVGSRYSLSLWIKTIYPQGFFTISFQVGSNFQQLNISPSDTAPFTNYKIENLLCTGNGTLQVYVSSESPAYIDDVSVVLGATALVL